MPGLVRVVEVVQILARQQVHAHHVQACMPDRKCCSMMIRAY